MKTSLAIFILALCAFAFQSCENDDNNSNPENEVVTKAFLDKYPEAARVDWEAKSTYLVADFLKDNKEAEAWFDKNGTWYMTETDVAFNDLPVAVKSAFSSGLYKDWRIDDIDLIERKGMEAVYVIEVENGNQDYDLYYSVGGTLIKAVADIDNSDDDTGYLPVTLSDPVKTYISTHYPQARILETDTEKNGTIDVDIIDGNTHRELTFQANGDWTRTKTEVQKSSVPQPVINALNASEFSSFRIDDIDYIETPQRNYYYFELESGSREAEIIITSEGVVEVVRVSND